MDEVQVAEILTTLAAFYSKFEVPDDESFQFKVWNKMLGDLDFEVAQAAIMKLIAESPFSPTVADIRKRVAEVLSYKENQITPGEAWEQVQKASNRWGVRRKQEGLESLSGLVRRAAESIGWRSLCLDEPGVVRAHYMKIYQQLQERNKEVARLPVGLKEDIKAISCNQERIQQSENVVRLVSGIGDY